MRRRSHSTATLVSATRFLLCHLTFFPHLIIIWKFFFFAPMLVVTDAARATALLQHTVISNTYFLLCRLHFVLLDTDFFFFIFYFMLCTLAHPVSRHRSPYPAQRHTFEPNFDVKHVQMTLCVGTLHDGGKATKQQRVKMVAGGANIPTEHSSYIVPV